MFRPRVTFTLLILESHHMVFVYREDWVTKRGINPSESCLWDDSHARESPGPWRSCAYAVDDLWNLHVSPGSLLELREPFLGVISNRISNRHTLFLPRMSKQRKKRVAAVLRLVNLLASERILGELNRLQNAWPVYIGTEIRGQRMQAC